MSFLKKHCKVIVTFYDKAEVIVMERKPDNQPISTDADSDETRDPYLNDPPDNDPAQCDICGNVYHNKRWYHPDETDIDPYQTTTCPGCEKVADGYFRGEVRLSGAFLNEHHDEIAHLIENEVDRQQSDNPLSKVVETTARTGPSMSAQRRPGWPNNSDARSIRPTKGRSNLTRMTMLRALTGPARNDCPEQSVL